MKVRLLTDLRIENRNLASGEVTEISELSGKLLIKKGMAIEYKEPASFTTRETAVINDQVIDKHNNPGGKRIGKHGKR